MDPSSFLATLHPAPQPSCLHPLDRSSFHIFFTLLLLFILLAFFLLCILLFFPPPPPTLPLFPVPFHIPPPLPLILRTLLLLVWSPFTILLLVFFLFCILHLFLCFFLLFPLHLPPYSLRLHSSSPSSFLFFLLSPLHSLFR